jgi:hypothetical protein
VNDIIVSARMPSSLLDELKEYSHKNHYMDISEAIRGILRHKWDSSSDPLSFQVGKIQRTLEEDIRKGIARKSEQLLVEELKKIQEKMKNEL